MQKFTRAITREIEVGGERVALTFTETGIQVRMVGSRRPPMELSWPAVVCQIASPANANPTAETLTQALDAIRGGKKTGKAAEPEGGRPGPEEWAPQDVQPEERREPGAAGTAPPDQEHIM